MTDSEGRLLTVQPLIAYGEGFVQGGDLLEAVPQCAKMELKSDQNACKNGYGIEYLQYISSFTEFEIKCQPIA